MTSGYRVGGTDLDNLFAAGNAGITTGFKVAGGGDLGNRYAGYSSGAKAGATGFVYGSTDLKDLFQKNGASSGLTASASPTDVVGSTTVANATVTTASATASATGGTGTYVSYAWSYVAGDSSITIVSPSSATTTFRKTTVPVNYDASALFQCVVTDSASNTATTNQVTAEIYGKQT